VRRRALVGLRGRHTDVDDRPRPVVSADPNHLIGQSKWFVNAEGYDHLSSCHRNVYAMSTIFVLNSSSIYVSTVRANRHAQRLVVARGPRDDLGQALGLGPAAAGRAGRHGLHDDHQQSHETRLLGGRHLRDLLEGPRAKPAAAAAGREGQLGPGLPQHHLPRRDRQYVRRRNTQVRNAYPLYLSCEDGGSSLSNVYVTASYDDGASRRSAKPARTRPSASSRSSF
jgi:hypothetical protein